LNERYEGDLPLFIDECCTSTLEAHHANSRNRKAPIKKGFVCVSTEYRVLRRILTTGSFLITPTSDPCMQMLKLPPDEGFQTNVPGPLESCCTNLNSRNMRGSTDCRSQPLLTSVLAMATGCNA
jgi:hypothetical protein